MRQRVAKSNDRARTRGVSWGDTGAALVATLTGFFLGVGFFLVAIYYLVTEIAVDLPSATEFGAATVMRPVELFLRIV